MNDKAHEAGCDAWMTGAVFANLLSLYQHLDSAVKQAAGEQAAGVQVAGEQAAGEQAALAAVAPHVGRINVSRSDYPYIALLGEDAVPDRSHVLVLTQLNPGLRVGEVQKALNMAKLGGWFMTEGDVALRRHCTEYLHVLALNPAHVCLCTGGSRVVLQFNKRHGFVELPRDAQVGAAAACAALQTASNGAFQVRSVGI